MRLLVFYALAPLLRALTRVLITLLLGVLLAPARGRAAPDTLVLDETRPPARCVRASEHGVAALGMHGDATPHDAPADPSNEGEDGEDEGSDDSSDGDVPALVAARPWPSAHAPGMARRRLRGGSLDPLRTRPAEAPDAPPPRP